ncbi:hypothetical protein ATO10_14919 [Actibacterium atlanticum]|uniref:DUF7716 domain-containing protein n=1 Tax=Actibacterium atlanticum TaxID=1461693 RepID=A0A058ZH86_9RHOB|nr:hypothetical protein [Actibacterium atlanticum]KCV80953.1 hypothetical protein ATO10_14919 [Actibacterium atlanticum]
MRISDPTVISFTEMTLADLMASVETYDGDFLLAFTVNDDGTISDDVLVLETDTYSEVDDEYLEFKGRNYTWDVDLYTLQSIKNFAKHYEHSPSRETLVKDAKYYLEFDAFRPRPE